MKKSHAITLVLIALVFLIAGGVYLVLRGADKFVSSFDGNNVDRKKQITGNYYFDPLDSTVWFKIGNASYREVAQPVERLSFSDSIIIGYSKGSYFMVNTSTENKREFTRRDSLLLETTSLPTGTIGVIPGVK